MRRLHHAADSTFADGFLVDAFWDFLGWNSAGVCSFHACTGVVTDTKAGFVSDTWSIVSTSVTLYRLSESQYDPQTGQIYQLGPPHTIALRLVPEPSTLLLAGIGMLGLGALMRRRA